MHLAVDGPDVGHAFEGCSDLLVLGRQLLAVRAAGRVELDQPDHLVRGGRESRGLQAHLERGEMMTMMRTHEGKPYRELGSKQAALVLTANALVVRLTT